MPFLQNVQPIKDIKENITYELKQPEHVTPNPSVTLNVENNLHNVFLHNVEEYVKTNKPYVYILTPCFGSVCYVNYTISLMNTIGLFKGLNIPLQIVFCKSDSLVSRARNNLVAKAMANPNMTHCIFIDNDITWDPADILKLIISDKHLIGGVYPLKKYNWNKLTKTPNVNEINNWLEKKNNSQLKDISTDEDFIQHKLLNYNVNYLGQTLTIKDNLAKVRHIATGFMLFRRETIENMFKAFPHTKYTDDVGFLEGDENKYAFALFDCGVEEDHYFSEDWLFCHRWSKMGGDVFLDVSINLKHTGIEDFNGSYLANII